MVKEENRSTPDGRGAESPTATFSTTNPIGTGLESNPCLPGMMPTKILI